MKIKKRYVPVLVAIGVMAAFSLALLLALFVNVGAVHAAQAGFVAPVSCDFDLFTISDACAGEVAHCWGPHIEELFGCFTVRVHMRDPANCGFCDGNSLGQASASSTASAGAVNGAWPSACDLVFTCPAPSVAVWLADVCEQNDGFSDDGAMTWDSGGDGPLEFAASSDGPWYEVQVNGPPWIVTEENMESFAAMVGADDWRDMWVRAGGSYPQHVGNTVAERDARMGEICE